MNRLRKLSDAVQQCKYDVLCSPKYGYPSYTKKTLLRLPFLGKRSLCQHHRLDEEQIRCYVGWQPHEDKKLGQTKNGSNLTLLSSPLSHPF